MSKLISDLNDLGKTRKMDEGVIIEESQENQEQVHANPEYKGIYFLSFLMILLIGFSVLSVSISIKTFSQLEASWDESRAILEMLSEQKMDITLLHSLIADNASEELAQINDIKVNMNELMVTMKNREDEFSEMKIVYGDFITSTEESIKALRMSDKLIMNQYILLSDEVQKLSDNNSFMLNTY